MKALINYVALLALFASLATANSQGDGYIPRKNFTPSSAIKSIYQELRDNPDMYDLEKAGQSQRAAIREYGEERAYPLLGEAILEQDHLIQVRSFFVILMETEKGRVVAEETARKLLSNESAGVPKQLAALEVIGDLGNVNNTPIVQAYLDNEDESIRLKAADILDDWKVDSAIEVPPTPPTSEVEEVAQESIASESGTKEPAKVIKSESSEESDEQSSQWWIWLVGVVAVVAGIGLAVRRKN